jgi:hypothetical protein
MSPGSSSPTERDRDLVTRHLGQELDHVLGVEADRDRVRIVLGLEFLADFAEVGVSDVVSWARRSASMSRSRSTVITFLWSLGMACSWANAARRSD